MPHDLSQISTPICILNKSSYRLAVVIAKSPSHLIVENITPLEKWRWTYERSAVVGLCEKERKKGRKAARCGKGRGSYRSRKVAVARARTLPNIEGRSFLI